MAKQGKFGKSEIPLRLKRVYFEYTAGRSNSDPIKAYNEVMSAKK